MRKQSSADWRRIKRFLRHACTARFYIYLINTQIAVCAMLYINANTDWHIFRTQKRWHTCVSYTRMKSVLLLWTPSLNDRSKLKGECPDVKSGCGISVGSKPPQSQLKQNSCDTVPLSGFFMKNMGRNDNALLHIFVIPFYFCFKLLFNLFFDINFCVSSSSSTVYGVLWFYTSIKQNLLQFFFHGESVINL